MVVSLVFFFGFGEPAAGAAGCWRGRGIHRKWSVGFRGYWGLDLWGIMGIRGWAKKSV